MRLTNCATGGSVVNGRSVGAARGADDGTFKFRDKTVLREYEQTHNIPIALPEAILQEPSIVATANNGTNDKLFIK